VDFSTRGYAPFMSQAQAQALAAATKILKIPETVLKKKKSLQQIEASRKKKRDEKRKDKRPRREVFKRPEEFVREFRAIQKTDVRMQRAEKQPVSFSVPADVKIAIVVRIRGVNGVSPKARNILKILRLRQIHNAVFVKLTKSTLQLLHLIEPFIAYGYPNLKTVRDLIYKRGFGRIAAQRIALNDNKIIEKALGKFNVVCTEDIVHEIFECGPNFEKINRFLWAFKLNPPRGGYVQNLKNTVERGDAGNHGDLINDIIRRMN